MAEKLHQLIHASDKAIVEKVQTIIALYVKNNMGISHLDFLVKPFTTEDGKERYSLGVFVGPRNNQFVNDLTWLCMGIVIGLDNFPNFPNKDKVLIVEALTFFTESFRDLCLDYGVTGAETKIAQAKVLLANLVSAKED